MILICWVEAYILKKTETLVVASKGMVKNEILKKTEYMITPYKEHARQNNNLRIGNKPFEEVEQFRYLEKAITNRSYIHKEIKSRQVRQCSLLFRAESFVFCSVRV